MLKVNFSTAKIVICDYKGSNLVGTYLSIFVKIKCIQILSENEKIYIHKPVRFNMCFSDKFTDHI
jgi:hypothetical protein